MNSWFSLKLAWKVKVWTFPPEERLLENAIKSKREHGGHRQSRAMGHATYVTKKRRMSLGQRQSGDVLSTWSESQLPPRIIAREVFALFQRNLPIGKLSIRFIKRNSASFSGEFRKRNYPKRSWRFHDLFKRSRRDLDSGKFWSSFEGFACRGILQLEEIFENSLQDPRRS